MQYVLEGSVRRSGPQLRVTAQLIRCDNQTQLWAQNYDIDLRGQSLLNVESDISMQVAAALDVRLTSDTATAVVPADRSAHDAYLLGLHALNSRTEEGLRQAVSSFETALEKDPNYAPAFAGIAQAFALNAEYYSPDSHERATRALAAAQRAVELDPSSVQALNSLAFVEWRFQRKYQQAGQDFKKAVLVGPDSAQAHHWYALFLASQRRFPEAQEQLRLALEFDPASLIIQTNRGWIAALAGDDRDARQYYQQVLERSPNFVPALFKLAWLGESEEKLDQPAELRLRLCDVMRANPESCHQLHDVLSRSGARAFYRMELELDSTNPFLNACERARLHTLIGEKREALEVLSAAVSARDPWMVFLNVEPAFQPYRAAHDPAFAALLKQVGY